MVLLKSLGFLLLIGQLHGRSADSDRSSSGSMGTSDPMDRSYRSDAVRGDTPSYPPDKPTYPVLGKNPEKHKPKPHPYP